MRARFCLFLIAIVAVGALKEAWATDAKPLSPRAQVTVENWDKGGPLSRWVYTHVSEVFPTAVVRRAGPVLDLSGDLRAEIGGLDLKQDKEAGQTLDQFVINGAVDGCIVLHQSLILDLQ